MQRYDIINHLIRVHDYKSYLEIGVCNPKDCFDKIMIDFKIGVDPNGAATHTMTSDEFFAQNITARYDIIFIDGLHLHEQVLKDIENSLTRLHYGGTIVMHDCLPEEEYQQFRDGISGMPWNGDTWKAFADMRQNRLDLEMFVIDTDWGCGIIRRRDRPLYGEMADRQNAERIIKPSNGWTWDTFIKHRDHLMNVITVEEFLNGCS